MLTDVRCSVPRHVLAGRTSCHRIDWLLLFKRRGLCLASSSLAGSEYILARAQTDVMVDLPLIPRFAHRSGCTECAARHHFSDNACWAMVPAAAGGCPFWQITVNETGLGIDRKTGSLPAAGLDVHDRRDRWAAAAARSEHGGRFLLPARSVRAWTRLNGWGRQSRARTTTGPGRSTFA